MAPMGGIDFDWDAENLRHLKRHRVTPEEFEEVVTGDPVYLELPGGERGGTIPGSGRDEGRPGTDCRLDAEGRQSSRGHGLPCQRACQRLSWETRE